MKCQRLLLLNLGTTSFKFQLYDFRNGEEVTASGMVERVGGDGFCRLRLPSGAAENLCRCRSCTEAFELCIRLMQEEGVNFQTNCDIGRDVSETLLQGFDLVIFACGAQKPRMLSWPTQAKSGVSYALDFLKAAS